jgi:hypothetical protein
MRIFNRFSPPLVFAFSLVAVAIGALCFSTDTAQARCVWYGPGSGPMPPCYHSQPSNPNITNSTCAALAGQPSHCANSKGVSRSSYGGIVYLAPGAQRTGTGFMAAGCRRTPWGINCSDMRLKRDIVQIGRLSNGIGVYRYKYKWSGQLYVGVLAQEVQRVMPEAVAAGPDGYLRVDYAKLGMPLLTWNQWTQTANTLALRPDI